MRIVQGLLIHLVITVLTQRAVSTNYMKYSAHHFHHLDNLYFDDQYFLLEIENVSKVECSRDCAETLECVSYFYNKSERKCRLHNSGWYNPQEGMTSSNWTYHVIGEDWCPVRDGFIHERSYNMCLHMSADLVNGTSGTTSYCESKNSSVVTFKNANKISNFRTIISKMNPTFLEYRINGRFYAYIGLRYDNGTWPWNDGSILSSDTNWAPHQPNLAVQTRCAAVEFEQLVTEWLWNDKGCSNQYPVICEIS